MASDKEAYQGMWQKSERLDFTSLFTKSSLSFGHMKVFRGGIGRHCIKDQHQRSRVY
jgi:hypothetical protein